MFLRLDNGLLLQSIMESHNSNSSKHYSSKLIIDCFILYRHCDAPQVFDNLAAIASIDVGKLSDICVSVATDAFLKSKNGTFSNLKKA
jgi:hypothetical protein